MSELALRRIVPENPASGVEVAGFLAKTTTVTEDYTIESDISTVNVDAASATITLPAATLVGRRVTVRKISASAGTVTINRAGADTITRAALTAVTLTSNGDFWTLECVASGRWELVDGYETGSNANGKYIKSVDGAMICTDALNSANTWQSNGSIYQTGNATWTFPATFLNTEIVVVGQADTLNIQTCFNEATTSSAVFRLIAGLNTSALPRSCRLQATGRWYA